MIASLLEQHLGGFSGSRILDIGPGYSAFSRLTARLIGATEITFVDFDQTILTWQREESQKVGINAITKTVKLDEVGISDLEGSYDLIHCQEVLEHLPNASTVLRSLAGKLAPGGCMVVTVPTRISERWLKLINPAYMSNEPYGHVNQFDQNSLRQLIAGAGLTTRVLVPTQPHYFIAHSWFYGSRMRSEASSGKILTGGVRGAVFSRIFRGCRWVFLHTGPHFWGRVFPRNYFVIATHDTRESS